MEEKIEKCPFCKNSATHLMTYTYDNDKMEYYCMCDKCEIESPTFNMITHFI